MDSKLPSAKEMDLLALIVTERTGREVAEAYRDATGRRINWSTLYTTMRRLKERGWVTVREGEDEDGRLRWFQITGAGSQAYSEGYAESSARMERLPRTLRVGGAGL